MHDAVNLHSEVCQLLINKTRKKVSNARYILGGKITPIWELPGPQRRHTHDEKIFAIFRKIISLLKEVAVLTEWKFLIAFEKHP